MFDFFVFVSIVILMSYVKLIAINTDVEPIETEKLELPTEDRATLKRTILDLLNKHGKNSTVLIGWKGELYTCSHTAKRGPSSNYYRQKIVYHPYSAEVL